MNFILTEEQRNTVLSAIQDFPLKSTFHIANLLFSLPLIAEDKKEEKENKENKK